MKITPIHEIFSQIIHFLFQLELYIHSANFSFDSHACMLLHVNPFDRHRSLDPILKTSICGSANNLLALILDGAEIEVCSINRFISN
jgi:hypothetical protein